MLSRPLSHVNHHFFPLASELTAAAVILQVSPRPPLPSCFADWNLSQYWDSRIATWQWALIIITPIFLMQLIHVRVYGTSMC